jgi:hypothetical protein
MAEFIGLRAGVLDDQTILDKAPMMEVYVERRMKWLRPVDGAMQMDAHIRLCSDVQAMLCFERVSRYRANDTVLDT